MTTIASSSGRELVADLINSAKFYAIAAVLGALVGAAHGFFTYEPTPTYQEIISPGYSPGKLPRNLNEEAFVAAMSRGRERINRSSANYSNQQDNNAENELKIAQERSEIERKIFLQFEIELKRAAAGEKTDAQNLASKISDFAKKNNISEDEAVRRLVETGLAVASK